MMRYATYADSGSLCNTPPVFAVYVVGLVMQWLLDLGGLAVMAERNERKARKLYTAIDRTEFYRGTAQVDSRSLMNVTFRLPTEELETRFTAAAIDAGLVGLKGTGRLAACGRPSTTRFPRTVSTHWCSSWRSSSGRAGSGLV